MMTMRRYEKNNFSEEQRKKISFPFCSPVEKLFLCIFQFPNIQLQYETANRRTKV